MIFWFDCETTGLIAKEHDILEVALIVTTDDLSETKVEYQAVVQQSQTAMDKMDDWCRNTHTNSGLVADVWGSNSKSIVTVQKELTDIANGFYDPKDRPILAGSSIQFDRSFIDIHLPYFGSRLHYRQIDVSTFLESLRRQYGFKLPKTADAPHRAMPDIKRSMEHYKQYLAKFKANE